MIKMLKKQGDNPENIQTHFILSDQLYMKADIPPTEKVCLWLGVRIDLFLMRFVKFYTI